DNVAAGLAKLIVGRSPRPLAPQSASNPDWTRDELIVALDFYLRHGPNPPNKGSKEIIDLSRVLNQLGAKLFRADLRSVTFRNENGVYMKLMNFRYEQGTAGISKRRKSGGGCMEGVLC